MQELKLAKFGLVVCTKGYKAQSDREKGAGRSRWSGPIITSDMLDELGVATPEWVAVAFSDEDREQLPAFLRDSECHDVSTESGYETLYRGLTGQSAIEPPQLGSLRLLPKVSQKAPLVAQSDSLPAKPAEQSGDKPARPSAAEEITVPAQLLVEVDDEFSKLTERYGTIRKWLIDSGGDRRRIHRSAQEAVLNGIQPEDAAQLGSVDSLDRFVDLFSRLRRDCLEGIPANSKPADIIAKFRETLEQHLARLPNAKSISILHLSDLHFDNKTSVRSEVQTLSKDLQKNLQVKTLDYLVVSGDVTDRGNLDGFERARQFVAELIRNFSIDDGRCILVPGNHDVVRVSGLFFAKFENGKTVEVKRDEIYPTRFADFDQRFFNPLIDRPYPPDPQKQGMAYSFAADRLQFLALNSCWQIDEFHPKESNINVEALTNALEYADRQARSMKAPPLRIAVCHHAVTDNDKIRDKRFLELLRSNEVRICLHGDVHEIRREATPSWSDDGIYVIGAGAFGAKDSDRPPSTPLFYNLLRLQGDHSELRVDVRGRDQPGGAWTDWAKWPIAGENPEARFSYYTIKLGAGRSTEGTKNGASTVFGK
jgi:3',5'-cyclic AMP phosphodiesterase CpdA